VPIPGGRRAILDGDLWPDPEHDPAATLSAMLSHPVWLVRRWLGRFGAAAALAALEAGNRHPEMAIRPNLLRTTRERLVERLRKENVEVDEGRLTVRHTGPLWRLGSFADGWFTVQDEAARRVAPLLDARPGELVADLCAAPGGKAGQLAEGTARVVAADSERDKVKGMRRSFERLGVSPMLLVADAKRPPFREIFDAVLVDVPCSNTGVLARRVEARWRVRERDVVQLAGIQRAILQAALSVTKPGGRVVYSTCSLEDEEDGALVREVIREGNGLRLEEEMRILPGARWTCGGYAARIRRMAR
jgi:16S rRNA (cytosine967-C5)-methyltransferase